ncbi:hypothetical protein J437_LFUL017308 [Ladona fulva]|uniref:Uncharacterized protein n=1 Tax=Ladona fulva TaxID=123851 RepID=A0A8K0P2F1_LADFU|nr:hypothetical protein J437_LFUL017308 [Ladona fulva]
MEQRTRLRKRLSVFEKQLENYHLKREYAREYLAFLKTYHPNKNERLVEEERLLKIKIKEANCNKEKSFKKIQWLSKKYLMIKSAMITISELLSRIRIPDELSSLNSIEVEPTLEELIYKTRKRK